MFGPMVNGAMHAAAMDSFGVNASRSNMAQLAQEVANADGAVLPFSQWWAQAAKCKGVGQWAVKLKALGMPTDEIGQKLCQDRAEAVRPHVAGRLVGFLGPADHCYPMR